MLCSKFLTYKSRPILINISRISLVNVATEQIPNTFRTSELRPSLFTKDSFWLLMATFVLAGILLFFIPELSRNYLFSVVAITLLLALCWTALPIAELLFDEKEAQRIFVFPIGFIFHAVLLSFAGYIFGIHVIIFAVYSILAAAFFFLTRRFKRSSVHAKANASNFQDTVWLFAWLAIVAAAVFFPFSGVGRETADGFTYRPYFNADFFRNMSVAGSLATTGIPPVNPYFSGFTLHYYWFFHIMAAFVRTVFPQMQMDSIMVQLSLLSTLMFAACMFFILKKQVQIKTVLILMLFLFVIGSDYKSFYVLAYLQSHKLSWAAFTTLNIEGMLRWIWHVPQIDFLYRAMLYAPQHLLALTAVLMTLLAWRRLNDWRVMILLSALVFASIGFSAFIGGLLLIAFSVGFLIFLIQQRKTLKLWHPAVVALIGLFFAAAYLYMFQMFLAGGTHFRFGLDQNILKHFWRYTIYNWGPSLFLGIAGCFVPAKNNISRWALISALTTCFVLIYCVEINLPGQSDISLKVGYLSHIFLLILAARFLNFVFTLSSLKKIAILTVFAISMVPAAITWAMDCYNTGDTSNHRLTTYVHPEDAKLMTWIRQNIPHEAVILNVSAHVSQFQYSIVPAFAERSVFLGDIVYSRIFQVPDDEIKGRRGVLSKMYGADTDSLQEMMQFRNLNYVFLPSHDALNSPAVLEKFKEPQFKLLHQEGDARIYLRTGQ
jgi:hypothetical protein